MSKIMRLIAAASLLGLTAYPVAYAQINRTINSVDHSGWVQIPGELIRPECVHEIPNGAKVETRDGQITGDITLNGALIAHYDSCSDAALTTRHPDQMESAAKIGHTPGTGNGWVEASEWVDNQNIGLILGFWNVPSNPRENGGLVYLFNGIEPANGSYILQPVLQYGVGAAGGGNYWAMASWLVGTNYAFHSPLVTTTPGHELFGYTEVTGASGSTLDWRVQATDETNGNYSWITASSTGLTWSWAFAAVLEAYDISSCSQLPANLSTTFSTTEIYQGTTTLSITNPALYGVFYGSSFPSCGYGVTINRGEVSSSTLKY